MILFLTITADAGGSIILYTLVYLLQENKFIKRLIKKANKENSIIKSRDEFKDNLALKIIGGRLFPYLRMYTSIQAGIMEVPFKLFALYSFIASTIWCSMIIYLGWRFSKYTLKFISTLSHYLVLDIIGVICILGIVFYSIYRFFTDEDKVS